jgi:hypothetical protein
MYERISPRRVFMGDDTVLEAILQVFFFKDNFRFKPWEYLFPQPSLVEKKWLVLVDGRNKETRMDVYSSFERMEVNRDSVGSLKS